MRLTKTFDMFGKTYETRQFAAAHALSVMAIKGDIHPTIILGGTNIIIDGERRSLSDSNAINNLVQDCTMTIAPRLVLNALMSIVSDYNFEFLAGWKGAKVPSRFIDDTNAIDSKNADPIISQLVQDNAATLESLEQYYSLEDAFKMFDILMVKGINSALAHEASAKKNKRH